ncbi:DUF892 family protein [Natronorubrum sp. A-ect3]|uniref:DUF892 family protein n=1 Tax=Natronorubrum sp. A-ect3 TaxID=3242698 RepID=UPI00359D01BE
MEQELADLQTELAEAATDEPLESYYMAHSEATAEQLDRLEPLFEGLGVEPGAIESASLSGLRTERDDRVADLQDPVLGDLVEAEFGRAIERLELTKLETLLTLADRMDLPMRSSLRSSRLKQRAVSNEFRSFRPDTVRSRF